MPSLNKFLLIAVALTLGACSTASKVSNLFSSTSTTTIGAFKVGTPYKIDGRWYKPQETYNFTQTGIASW